MLCENIKQIFPAVIAFIILATVISCQKSKKLDADPVLNKTLTSLAAEKDLIVATFVKEDLPLDPFSPVWNEATKMTVPLVPQTSVVPRTPVTPTRELTVRALYNDNEAGFLLQWADASQDESVATNSSFADTAAIAFPMKHTHAAKLPYIGMGHKDHPVNIWHWKASWQADVNSGFQGVNEAFKDQVPSVVPVENLSGEQAGSPLSQKKRKGPVENLLAEGFGTLTSTGEDTLEGKGVFKGGYWHVVIKRDRKGSEVAVNLNQNGLVPVTFAVWDGARSERNGMKAITHWRFLRFERETLSKTYLEGFSAGPIPGGDAERGKQMVNEAGCFQCHQFPDGPAVTQVGPDLTYAGAIHRPEYLMESLKDPNAVIVPAPGYFNPETGLSTMPSYVDVLEEQHYKDIVEYLRSLQ